MKFYWFHLDWSIQIPIKFHWFKISESNLLTLIISLLSIYIYVMAMIHWWWWCLMTTSSQIMMHIKYDAHQNQNWSNMKYQFKSWIRWAWDEHDEHASPLTNSLFFYFLYVIKWLQFSCTMNCYVLFLLLHFHLLYFHLPFVALTFAWSLLRFDAYFLSGLMMPSFLFFSLFLTCITDMHKWSYHSSANSNS